MNLVERLRDKAESEDGLGYAYNAEAFKEAADRIEALEVAHEHILEYWNKDENPGAMSDALWHILDTAAEALNKGKDQ